MKLLAVGITLVFASFALAQETAGAIGGRVLDAAGAAVPAAEVTATHIDTGAVQKVTADAEGAYLFPALPIGGFRLGASHPGFKRATKEAIELHVHDRLTVNLELQVGDVTQEVTVTADAAQVEIASSEQSGLISGDQVRDLQLNGRSFLTLLELVPGVASDMPDRTDPNQIPLLNINGTRYTASTLSVDGGNNADPLIGSGPLNTLTSIETIAEFKVLTSTFAAEFGRGGVSQINVVTRGGTRQYHGGLFHFFRNDALDARDYFSHKVLPLKLNNFGYNFGGPVSLAGYNRDRKKTFFLINQEYDYINMRATSINTAVPGLAMRQGDFRELGPGRDGVFGTADDPVVDPQTNLGFPNGIIPASRIDPNARKLIDFYPAPNFQGPGNTNYTSAAPSTQRVREDMIRIDQVFGERWKMFGRFTHMQSDIRNPYGGNSTTSVTNRFPGFAASFATRPGKNLTISQTVVPGKTLLDEFLFTYSAYQWSQEPASELTSREKLGIRISEIFPENPGDIIPAINLGSNYAALTVSRVGGTQVANYDVSNNLTKISGRHAIKTGGLYSRGRSDAVPVSPFTNGSFTFNTAFSRNAVANFLLGLPVTYTEAEQSTISRSRYAMFEAFVQDDYRVTGRLTLNAGVRYSAYRNPYDDRNVLANFLPGLFDPRKAFQINPSNGNRVPGTGDALNGLAIAGKNSPYGRRVAENNLNLLGPRFGFAWDIFGKAKTAVRGGYGIYYSRPMIQNFIQATFDNPPFTHTVTINNPSFSNPVGGTETPSAAPPSVTAIGVPLHAPTIQQWSFGVQQQVLRTAIVNVSYVGSRGTHLMHLMNLNNPEPGVAALNRVNVNAVRPYPGWGSILSRDTTGVSNYHSLQVSVNRRLARGLTFGLAYTFSKSIDIASSDYSSADLPADTRDTRRERGPSDFDRTRILNINSIWALPRIVPRGLLAPVLNGWQLSGIARFNSGRPFDVIMSSDVAGIGGTQNQRPDVIADTRGRRTVEDWFNRYAFARPASGTFGNMGRNSLRGPGIHKWDLAAFKNFTLREGKLRWQFRAEMFNAFNHPSFTGVSATLTTTASGVDPLANGFATITGTRDARVVQFALKVNF
jgi:hypothetical protein